MDDSAHLALLSAIKTLKGMVILSGYPCPFYDDTLTGWSVYVRDAAIAGKSGSVKRTECLWLNPATEAARTGVQLELL
jgi:DNA adenine methylase